MAKTLIKAIIWDYDGTLVDTGQKNMNVTKKIIESITATDATAFRALRSLENYSAANRKTANWRELYCNEFDLAESQIDDAGRLWTTYQLNDDTEVSFYAGIKTVLEGLAQYPQGIVSQNSRSNITQNLERYNLRQYFQCIVGYEEVDIKKQKPAPDGLLDCLKRLCPPDSGYICYIGDHLTDVQCVNAANRRLQQENIDVKILSIGACYDSGMDISSWDSRPDFEAYAVKDIAEIVDHIRNSSDERI